MESDINKLKLQMEDLIKKFDSPELNSKENTYFSDIADGLRKALEKMNQPNYNTTNRIIKCNDCSNRTKLKGFKDRNWQEFHSGYICPSCISSRWGMTYCIVV